MTCFALSGDVFEEMALCQKKIEQLQEDVGNFMQVDSAIHADTEVELESDMRVSSHFLSVRHVISYLKHARIFYTDTILHVQGTLI